MFTVNGVVPEEFEIDFAAVAAKVVTNFKDGAAVFVLRGRLITEETSVPVIVLMMPP